MQNAPPTKIGVAPITVLMSTTPNQDHPEEESVSVKNRVSRIEQDIIKIFRKLDEMLVTMDEILVTNHNKTK